MSWQCFFDWLDKWQTLVSGSLALLAASLAAGLLYWQIRVQLKQIKDFERISNDAIKRRGFSLRVRMSFALDSICVYAKDCFNWAWEHPGYVRRMDKKPLFPQEAIDIIASNIEFADNNTARYLATLSLQCRWLNEDILKSDIEVFIILHAVIVRSMAGNAFAFSHLHTDSIDRGLDEKSMTDAFNVIAEDYIERAPDRIESVRDQVIPTAVATARNMHDLCKM